MRDSLVAAEEDV